MPEVQIEGDDEKGKGQKVNEQETVYANIVARGYAEGWTDEQFAARQLAKLTEEVGELGDWIAQDTWEEMSPGLKRAHTLYWARHFAKQEFDSGNWKNARVTNIEQSKVELADIQVVVFCLAQVLAQLSGEPFDVIAAAVEKSGKDVKRGVR
jgi:NTP pyrophosphatase (non-canonical NTP hydrolase)